MRVNSGFYTAAPTFGIKSSSSKRAGGGWSGMSAREREELANSTKGYSAKELREAGLPTGDGSGDYSSFDPELDENGHSWNGP